MTSKLDELAQRKDMFFLENLAIPGEITSAAVGHFQNLKQNLLILAKSTILSLYVYDSEQGKFHLLDHKHVFRQVLSIHTVPQHHSLDCLLVVSVNGEWLFLQWHENDFFPLASGSLMDAALRIMKNPEQRRFRINPTFQFSVLIIPQDEDSTTQISKPEKPQNFQQIIEKEIHNFDSVSNIINSDQKPIQRISLRAICFVDEVVCVGLSYDGPGSDLMYDISEKMDETLMNIPQMCGWGDGYSVTLDNGLEHIWRAKQKSKETVNETFAQKEKVVIAQAQTFIFFKEELNEIDGRNVLMLDTIHRVRHAAYTRNMHLPKFPFQCTQSEDHSFDNIASIYLIVDTPEGVCLSSFILNFANQTLKMGQFAVVGLPCSTSRIIILHDNQNHNSSQFCNELIQQNLIGSIPVNVQFINNVKGSNLFLALSGQQIKIASKEQRELIAAKKLQKLILSKRSKSKMISIHIKQNTLTPPLEGSPISEEFPSPSSSIQSSPSIQEIQSETCDYISHSFVPYILASSKAIILQQSINKAFVFPFPTTLQVPPFGFCHVYVEDRTELEQEQQQNSDQQIEQHQSPLISQQKDKTSKFVHKLLLGGGKDIITIQEGQIQQQHYETKCINDILIIQPKQNNPKPEKLKPKEQADKRIKHTTAVVTTSSGTPLLMHLDTGQIIEVGEEDDDFALPTGQIQYAINIPPKWENKQVQEDRMAFGVAHGITGTGELQLVSVGHKMKEIIKDNWICGNAKLFSSQQFAGRGIREFLLAQDESIIQEIIPESISNSINLLSSPMTLISPNIPSPFPIPKSTQSTIEQSNSLQQNSNRQLINYSPYEEKSTTYPDFNANLLSANNINEKLINTPQVGSVKTIYTTKLFQLNKNKITTLNPLSFGINPNKRAIAFHELQGAIAYVSENDITILCTLKYKGHLKQLHEEQIPSKQIEGEIQSQLFDTKQTIQNNIQQTQQQSIASSDISSSSLFSSSSSSFQTLGASTTTYYDTSQSSLSSYQTSSFNSQSVISSSIPSATHDSNEHDKSTQNTESLQIEFNENQKVLTLDQQNIQNKRKEDIIKFSDQSQINPIKITQQSIDISDDNHKEQTSSQNVIEPFTPKLPLSPPKSPTILVIRATPMRSKNSVGTFWKVPPWLTSDECKSIIEQRVKLDDVIQQISFNPLRQITIDHAAVGDNVIVVSHKSIVYILLWHPAIPIILSQKKQQASWNRATRLALIAYYSSQQNATNKVLNQIDRTISQVELTEQSQIKMQMHLQVVCTLKFSSNVDALAASTICGNQFIVVCTKDPNMARVFRLSNLENDIEFQKENQKLWGVIYIQ